MGCGASTSASEGAKSSKSKPLSAGNNLPPVIGAQPVKIEVGKKLGASQIFDGLVRFMASRLGKVLLTAAVCIR